MEKLAAQQKVVDLEALSLEELVDQKLQASLGHAQGDDLSGLHTLIMQQVERPLIRTILEKTNGNQLKAAAILGINRNTLRKKLTVLKLR